MAVRSLVEVLARADTEQLLALLAEDVTFASPVADYHGRDDVAHLLGYIAQVLAGLTATGTACDDAHLTTFTTLTAIVEGNPVDGVLHERHDPHGHLVHATLFVRPYRTLRTAINAMASMLSADPLPSARP